MNPNVFRLISDKIVPLLERLSSKPVVGGLHVTNAGVQYVRLGKKIPETFAFRFPPGVIQDGKIQNVEQFTSVLRELHRSIAPDKSNETIEVTVALPAGSVFTQSFEIPNIDEEKIEESARLNLQIISPLPAKNAYMSWEMLRTDPEHFEMLGAFIEKTTLDALRGALIAEHFHPVAFEFPALSLTRLLAQSGSFAKETVLLLQVTSDGIDLSVVRGGKLYFDYLRSWSSIQGDAKQISRDAFDSIVAEEVRKVVNFSLSRFKESIASAVLVAPGFEKEVTEVLEERLRLPSAPLSLVPRELSPVWYVAWGAAFRESLETGKEKFINLNYETSADLFFEEHVIGFVNLWRNVFSLVFGFFLIVFAVAAFYLAGQYRSLEERLVISKNQIDQNLYTDLVAQADSFNQTVAALEKEPRSVAVWHAFFTRLNTAAGKHDIVLQRVDASSLAAPIRVAASAPDNAKTLEFKKALAADPAFFGVDLPLASIKEAPDGSVSFFVNFSVNSKAFE